MAEKMVETVGIPQGVEAELGSGLLKVRGPGRENSRVLRSSGVFLKRGAEGIEVWVKKERRDTIAEARTIASHIRNLITGLSKTFECRLEVVYSHFPMNITVKEKHVEIYNLAGAKHPRKAKIVGNTKVEVKGKDVTVKGHNKDDVGQTAANMEQVTRVKGKDIRVFQDRIYVTSKVRAV